MMPVAEINRRRRKGRAPPPGFNANYVCNMNNSAEKKKAGITPIKFLKKLAYQTVLYQTDRVKKRVSSPEPVEDSLFNTYTYRDTVGGEDVLVNKIELDEPDTEMQIRDNLTPDNYTDNYDYYFQINQNRKDIFTVIHRLGELLVYNDIEGDVDGWAKHIEKLDRDTLEWKRRCRESDAYFEKTRRIKAVDERTTRYRLKRYISEKAENIADCFRSAFHKAKEQCPLLNKICPCIYPSPVERVRSIYSESWHWDEPVPD